MKELLSICIPCLATGCEPPVEPIKMTLMPSQPWEKVHLDFKGPLPGGKYLLVLVDPYTRYPEVEIISSTNCNIVISKLRRAFASHGIPKILVTDNGPPFHSNGFNEFINEFGIDHKFSTPYWPQGNAEVKRFMKTLQKMLVIADMQHMDLETCLLNFLFQYRNAPHCTTKVPPSQLLYNRTINGKIPSMEEHIIDKHEIAKENENKAKSYNKEYADNKRKISKNNINLGDQVLIKQRRRNKLMSKFNPHPCTVIAVNNPDITVSTADGKIVRRNRSLFKKIEQYGKKEEGREEEEEEDDEFPLENDYITGNDSHNAQRGESEVETNDLRRSTRIRNIPDRYGIQIPSKFITDTT